MTTTIVRDDNECEIAQIMLPSALVEADKTGLVDHVKISLRDNILDHVRLMPDCHVGEGCCVGLSGHLQPLRTLEDGTVQRERVIPGQIGPDIGCGILTYPLGQMEKFRPDRFDTMLRGLTPIGNGQNDAPIHNRAVVTLEEMDELYKLSQDEAEAFANTYCRRYDLDISAYIPHYSTVWFKKRCKTYTHTNFDIILRGLGTLGGGNHFIEVNRAEDDEYWLTIHCGSRNWGQKVCGYHQGKISGKSAYDEMALDREVKRLTKQYKKDRETRDRLVAEAVARLQTEKHPPYLEGSEAYEYYFDMIFTQNYARLNRRIILKRALTELGLKYDPDEVIESVHNYIDFRDFILRKGAIPARRGELCIISLNMRDGSLLCRGKGNEEWNSSCAHGAGRLMSRAEAFATLDVPAFVKMMEAAEVYSTSVGKGTLDESPMAYKDTAFITQAISPSVEVVKVLKPVLNIKAWSR